MAQIHSFDDFSGPNERAVAEQLAAELPTDWTLICNKQISSGTLSREIDFICVAKRTVFTIEEKGWSGAIRGTENGWLVRGEIRGNPINQSEMCAKVLAGVLKNRWPQKLAAYRAELVKAVVLMSSPSATLNLSDPRARQRVVTLSNAAGKLQEIDQQRTYPAFGALKDEIVQSLTRLPQRPKEWASIAQYKLLEALDEQLGCKVFRAQHEDGSKRILKVFYGQDALSEAPADDSSVRRQYDAQKRLSRADLCPSVSPYFTWDDGRALVIPFESPRGVSFSKMAISGPSPEQIVPMAICAFETLSKVHASGVVHRSLRPDRVWWDSKSNTVQFSDFVIAHIDGVETIVGTAHLFDVDHPYRAAECRIDLSAASPKSDVYSLATVLLNWITGTEPPGDDTWAPGPLIDLRKDIGESIASVIESTVYKGLELEPNGRPTAAEIASSLRDYQSSIEKATQASSESSSTDESRPTDVRYEVMEKLGKGGTAEAFLARDLVRNELVVLKRIIRPDIHGYLADAEFQALRRLTHPCLPKLIDVYGPNDPYHLKFEYVEGQSLKDAWRSLRGQTPEILEKLARRIAGDVLDALEYLHQQNTLHRDVTPGNILLPEDDDARVLLIDLGLASHQADAVSRVGTPLYLAPEIEHPSPVWSPACDLYGLGVVLFELLSGSLPYRVEGNQRHKTDLIPFSTDEDSITSSVCRLMIEKACCPEPSRRFENAGTMRKAIFDVYNESYRRQKQEEVELHVPEVDQPTDDQMRNASIAPEPQDRSEETNDFVTELRQVFRNSTLGNANNRGMDNGFSRDTYVPTELDDRLLPEILDGRWKCIALSGNPGDGKTAFLEEVRRALLAKGARELERNPAGWRIQLEEHVFCSVFDASESHEDLSSDELLTAAIEPLSGRKAPQIQFTALLAINDGKLKDLTTKKRLSFRWLCDALRKQMDGEVSGEEVLLIDLKHRAPISADPKQKSLFLGLLDAFVRPDNFEVCRCCSAFDECPIRHNAQVLRHPQPREKLVDLLAGVYFLAERRPTIRDLRSAMAWMITGDRGCSDIHASTATSELAHRRYYNLAFDPQSGEDLVLDAFKGLDPGSVSNPALERRLTRPNVDSLFTLSGIQYPIGEDQDREALHQLKRRYFFELTRDVLGGLPDPSTLIPSRSLHLFRDIVSGQTHPALVKDRLLTGLRRLDRVPKHAAAEGLALRLDSSDESLIVIRQWPADAFELIQPTTSNRFLNYLPDHFILRHVSGWPEMTIGLQMFELLMRAADGTTPDAAEHQSLLMDFQRLRAQLLTSPTHQVVLVTSGGDRSLVTSCEGKIMRQEEAIISHV
ncbi:Serine/threonine-protein kinase PrkC [Rubripirellula lacrimiformis]|uniref:non-specific serine/threonine protein kinase n=1 Tax=Rubripirellula lacrimiformis TaxID=1930273 RepID=A0A517NAT7_9BACT|nr:protein kinase [Rubripirellula lacrimiformis]QDT04247.1 Serine/threonine-protein kinase PrkC [Rubripirellula lacrimiformis]